MEEQQVDAERVVADGQRVFLADECQVATEFEEEVSQVGEDRVPQFLLGVRFFKAEKFQDVVISERQQIAGFRISGQAFLWLVLHRDVAGEECRIDLPS